MSAQPTTTSDIARWAFPLAMDRPCVVGILNVTPDSFSDGGRFDDAARGVAHARAMAAAGAGIIDIGAESTRPGHTPIGPEMEAARLLPVLDALAGTLSVPISVDTTKAVVARAALGRGATIVNDQWGLQGDPAMAAAVAEAGAGLIVMHNRATIDDTLDVAEDLRRFFDAALVIAARAGIVRDRIVLDPGIGFGKTPRQQAEALGAIPGLVATFGLPILVGVSRKSFLGRLTGSPAGNRLPETIAANTLALAAGARLFRVHDVAEHVAALAVAAALLAAHPAQR